MSESRQLFHIYQCGTGALIYSDSRYVWADIAADMAQRFGCQPEEIGNEWERATDADHDDIEYITARGKRVARYK